MLIKKIQCVDTGDIYKSSAEAGRCLNLNASHISACCLGKRKSTGGYTFKFIFAEDETLRKCCKCKEDIPKDIKSCIPCRKLYMIEYKKQNRKILLKNKIIYGKRYREEHKVDITIYNKIYCTKKAKEISLYQAGWYIENKNAVNKRNLKWQQENRDKTRVYWHNRNDKIGKNKLSPKLKDSLYLIQHGLCACCGEILTDSYELDHIMPIKLGGLNIDSNIQLLNKICNRRKSFKHPDDYMNANKV